MRRHTGPEQDDRLRELPEQLVEGGGRLAQSVPAFSASQALDARSHSDGLPSRPWPWSPPSWYSSSAIFHHKGEEHPGLKMDRSPGGVSNFYPLYAETVRALCSCGGVGVTAFAAAASAFQGQSPSPAAACS